MKIIVAGSGKLANEIRGDIAINKLYPIVKWEDIDPREEEKLIIVHAGSGRQLEEIINYCNSSNSILIELATGTKVTFSDAVFPIIICPNISTLMVKFLILLKTNGKLFQEYSVKIEESHQKAKTSVAGTAVKIAEYLGKDKETIISYRDLEYQKDQLGINEDALNRHALHRITINDGIDEITMTTRIQSKDTYVRGLISLLRNLEGRKLENKIYSITDIFLG